MWNNLEANYREQLARIESSKDLSSQKEWLQRIPTKELIERGAIEPTTDTTVLIERTLRFFGVACVESWMEGWSNPQFAFRKSPTAAGHDGALATWLRLAELEAQDQECSAYDAKAFSANVRKIRELTTKSPEVFVSRMSKLCAEAGVALALVPEIKGARVNGAAKWITPTKAMIALNLLGKSNDLFWFTFFHEAGHVLNDSKKELFVDIEYADDPREEAANTFARHLLIPPQYESELPSLRTYAAVESFARRLKVAPGIVVGRLQREKVIPYSHLNGLKVRLDWES
jgi:Zn-dependent peptidase ImmA (M78 family)